MVENADLHGVNCVPGASTKGAAHLLLPDVQGTTWQEVDAEDLISIDGDAKRDMLCKRRSQ